MRYLSTRGEAAGKSFEDVLIAGLAGDGGLYVPELWPSVPRAEIAGFARQDYPETAFNILRRLIGPEWSDSDLKADIAAAYAPFDGKVAPLTEIGTGRYLLELFHGPTLAFKDIAMQLLGRLFSRALERRGGRATVLAATSGDTGSAAIAALAGLPNISLFVLHPEGRVSEVQRRQMTTCKATNVHNIALKGSFDDAQGIVKALFADTNFAAEQNLTAVNSINFARIAAQTVYYFTAVAQLGTAPVFVVPTGNFGDVFAGEAAMRMGLPVERLVVATNANDIAARAIETGIYAPGAVKATLSPSMDIQVASNFERALFEASGRDALWLRRAMAGFAAERRLDIPPSIHAALRARYTAAAISDETTLAVIEAHYKSHGTLIDPHTAVGLAAAGAVPADGPVVVLSTAHPAKFPDAVRQASGQTPLLPDRLSHLYDGEERMDVLENRVEAVHRFISDRAGVS